MVQNTFNIFNMSAISSTFFKHSPPGIDILNILQVRAFLEDMLEIAEMLTSMVLALRIGFRKAHFYSERHSFQNKDQRAIRLSGVTELEEETGYLKPQFS